MLASRVVLRERAKAAARRDALVALHAQLRRLEDALVACELGWGEAGVAPLRRATVKRWGNVAQAACDEVAAMLHT